jgi:hypothetical protein
MAATDREKWDLSVLTARLTANICGTTSLLISLLYWACILLPKPYWPFVCPWGQSMRRFVDFMLVGLALSIVAVWKGPGWWIGAVILAIGSFMFGCMSF